MNNKLSVIVIAMILSMLITPSFAKAIQEDNQMLVDASGVWSGTTFYGVTSTWNIYDYGAKVWGNYITWTRAIDLNGNGIVSGDAGPGGQIYDRNEPSWIMICDTNNASSARAITPTVDAGIRTGSGYYHAEASNVWNKKVIYIDNLGAAGVAYQYKLKMYNISFSETWTMPQPAYISHRGGIPPAFYGDYIIYGNSYWDGVYSNVNAYLYNWVADDYGGTIRTLCPDTVLYRWVQYKYILLEDFAIYSGYVSSASTVEYICIQNITSRNTVAITEGTLTSFLVDSAYEELLGISTYDGVSWDAYMVDNSFINWSAVYSPSVFDNLYSWSDIDDYITVIANSTKDEGTVLIWDNYVAYATQTYGYTDANINIYSISHETTSELTSSAYPHVLCDFKGDKVIYTSNINSNTAYGDARDDFDIYRTQTELESVGDVIWAAAPFVITLMILGSIFVALKMFGDSA